ncbi:MAG: tyrosine-type recombinase/integrase [Bacteroidales bacterium]|nr:tyrosine-type recombinase/integrase [Candidatus Equimonas enterica]
MNSLEASQRLEEGFYHYLLVVKGRSARTVETYRAPLTQFRDFWQSKDECLTWQTVDTDLLRLWVADLMRQGRAVATVRRGMSAVRSFFRYLLIIGEVKRDPMHLVKAPKMPRRLPTFMREDEMNRLFEDYDFGEGYLGSRNRLIPLTLYHTGIRASEAIGLTTADIDLERHALKVTGKGNKQRIVPFGEELAAAFADYLPQRQEHCGSAVGALLLKQSGKPLRYDDLRAVVHEALAAVCTRHRLSPHVLRHTFATVMLNNGASLEAIQHLLGHANLDTTAIYAHTSVAEIKREYAAAHPREKSENET